MRLRKDWRGLFTKDIASVLLLEAIFTMVIAMPWITILIHSLYLKVLSSHLPMNALHAITGLSLIGFTTSSLVLPEASFGKGVDERIVECMCRQREIPNVERGVGMCTGHYMGEHYQDKCGTNKSCLAKQMNNGLGQKMVNASLCK